MRIRLRPTLVLAVAVLTTSSVAAPPPAAAAARRIPQYRLIDVGTFGGPQAFLNGPGLNITRHGAVLGTADTTSPDPDYPNNNPFLVGPDPVLAHAFSWRHGTLADLGALPGNTTSAVFEVNSHGVGVGMSTTPAIDTYTGYPTEHTVLFRHGAVTDLGTLPGGQESQALAVNHRGMVAGFGNNGVPDPVSVFPWGTQTRSFVWQHGHMRDLGTLGGPDATMTTMNERGQIVGDSYLDATPNPGTDVPTTHPFLWQDGHMRDLGTLGGTLSGTSWLNKHGEVVGFSTLAGDETNHPFLWDGHRLRDLGTLGGNYGLASYVSDSGIVVGGTSLRGGEAFHAFLWRHGRMTDLSGPDDPHCSFAEAVNNRGDAVGNNCDETAALLWHGGHQYDLTSLAGPTDVQLTEAPIITNRSEIAAVGLLPDGSQHVFLLRPCRDRHSVASSAHASVRTTSTRACPARMSVLDRTRHVPDLQRWFRCS